MRIGNKTIDEKYSAIVEPNLYPESVFIPGVTCTDKYRETDAGVIYVHKLGAKTIEPALPGGDYVHSQTQDSLIQITLNNEFMYSEKISKVADIQTAYPIVIAELEDIIKTAQEARDIAGLACLGYEGTAVTSNTALTKDNIKGQLLAVRAQLSKAKVAPTTVLCSSETYGIILDAAGTQFTPVTNEKMVTEGRVGRWLGFDFIECPDLQKTAAKYYDYAGTSRTVDLSGIDFIMYNREALSIIDQLNDAAVVDGSPIFPGSFVQVDMVSGFKVTNPACVVVRKYVAPTNQPG